MALLVSTLIVIFMIQISDSSMLADETENSRVFKGRLAKEGEFQYVVAIYRFNVFYCGGSMISGQTVLTAAHCVVKSMNPPTNKTFHPTTFKIGYGSLDLTKIRKMPVTKVMAKDNPLKADVAILWTKYKLPEGLTTVSLPRQGAEFRGGTKIQIVGWGDINSMEPSTLLRTTSSILTNNVESCLAKENASTFKLNRICGEKINGSGVCRGDSGGPVIAWIRGQPVVIGINSYLREECDTIPPKHGMVFAKISLYTDWLRKFSLGNKPNVV